ncbi:protein of unknown function (plasmid) [Pararobbsia alpina]
MYSAMSLSARAMEWKLHLSETNPALNVRSSRTGAFVRSGSQSAACGFRATLIDWQLPRMHTGSLAGLTTFLS